MHVMRLHVPTEFVLVILWRRFRDVYELKQIFTVPSIKTKFSIQE